MARRVHVTAPSRLHFGMLSVNRDGTRHYGGVGAMISPPSLVLTIEPAPRLEVIGPMGDRARQAALQAAAVLNELARLKDNALCATACLGAPIDQTLLADRGSAGRLGQAVSFGGTGLDNKSSQAVAHPSSKESIEPACRIEVLRSPPQHVGLGSGTQLAMAIAAGLNAFWGRPPLDAPALARSARRGQRSAIGLYGFVHGGLLYEPGKTAEEEVSPLGDRVAMPDAWRFVLIRPLGEQGLSGEAERRAFAALPPVPSERSEALRREAVEHLLPAAAETRFDDFSESLYRFGYLAGLSFAAQQGGAFAGPRITALVEWLRNQGVRGVGQSSWGPTLFALLPNQTAAAELIECLQRRADGDTLELTLATPYNQGARIDVLGS